MGLQILEPNSCIRGCCHSNSIPLHLPPSSYTLLSPIARGAESVVYEGILDGRKVAVRKPILSTSDHIDKFLKELQLLCSLDHPGLARLVAAHARPPNYMYFFEYYESGTLSGKLHVDEWTPAFDQVLSITLQLAKALQYLHNQGIVHRDVKPANVLVIFIHKLLVVLFSVFSFRNYEYILRKFGNLIQLDGSQCPYLADFGLADYKKNLKEHSVENWKSSGKPTGGFHKKNMVGTLIYMAPEILRKEIHTEKSDVYSFGITINELLTGVVPYTDLRAEAQAHTVLEMNYTEQQLTAAVVSGNLRPVLADLGSDTPAIIPSLIQRCWDDNPQKRPSFSEIVTELDSLLEHRTKSIGAEQTPGKSSISRVNHLMNSVKPLQTYQEGINWSIQGEKLSKQAPPAIDDGLKFWLDSSDDPVYHPTLSWGSFASCGRRESMEDTHFLMPHFCNNKDIHVFGIFDGHRGAAAAEFSARALPGFLQGVGSARSPAEALFEAFVNTDTAFRNELDTHRESKRVMQKDWHPGCTAVASLIVRNRLFVANAGDCRTILSRAGQALPLSKDHVASCLKERERVICAGGQVKWQVDTWRVGPAALQVTRSIGDDDLKPAVTSEPEITETVLSAEDDFLVMASDGLWDVVSNEEVISIIKDTVKEPSMCSKRLATEAAERGSKDNITVIVVFLRPVSTAERIY